MKTVLILVAVTLSILGIYLSSDMLRALIEFLSSHPLVMLLTVLAIVVQLVGHALRAKRTKLVLDQAAPSSLRFQFGALSAGYLFNTLLPLRLGELVRALLVARRLHISFLYTFVAVVIERTTDVLFLGVLIIVGTWVISGAAASDLVFIAAGAILIAIAFLYLLILLKNENKYLLKAVSVLTGLFNVSISNKLRFKAWSLIFGLQSFFGNKALVRQYVLYATLSWVCYFISASIIVTTLLSVNGVLQVIATSISPYIISVNPLDAGSYNQLVSFLPVHVSDSNLDIYGRLIWAVLTLPMAMIGIISLFLYRTGTRGTAKQIPTDPYVNKLLRHEDISQEFPAFLETYFKGFSLSRILHKIELNGELSLVKFFKGGSDAITVLAMKGDKLFVKKIVPAEHTDKLRVQYKWLEKQADKKAIVNVLSEHKTEDYYAIDLSYDPENISLFEYVHTHSLEQATRVVDDVWKYVFKHLYSLGIETVNKKERDVYIQNRLMDKMKSAVSKNEDLGHVIGEKKIKINGETYDNFYTIMDKIKNHKQAWHDLAVYRKSPITHGDLTVDNILVDSRTDKPFIIDPSDDNQIHGPVIDFARYNQSLAAGYEFLNNDDEQVKAKKIGSLIAIDYHDRRSARYMQLHDYFDNVLAKKYMTKTEHKTLLFHTGLLYGRMLAHRIVINPNNTLKYYAVSVVLLNEFYRQYE